MNEENNFYKSIWVVSCRLKEEIEFDRFIKNCMEKAFLKEAINIKIKIINGKKGRVTKLKGRKK